MRKKFIIRNVIWWILSFVLLLLFSSRTSPLYSILMGDYAGSEASAAMVVGKNWLEGMIPYKDLYILAKPYYLFVQAMGWLLTGKYGIFVLQIISYTVFLELMWEILRGFLEEKQAIFISLLNIVLYIPFCDGGNTSAEWCLPWIALEILFIFRNTKRDEKHFTEEIVIGIACGVVLLTRGICAGIALGSLLTMMFMQWKESKRISWNCIWGLGIPIVGVIIYFGLNIALNDLLSALVVLPFRMLGEGFCSIELVAHKVIKCILVCPSIWSGYLLIKKKKSETGILLIGMSIFTILFLLLGDNSWNCFIVTVPLNVISVAVICSKSNGGNAWVPLFGALLCIGTICLIPIKNYISYLSQGIIQEDVDFTNDLAFFYEENPECEVVMIDLDSTYYLALDKRPTCKYFTNQSTVCTYRKEAAEEMEKYLNGKEDIDVLVRRRNGWIEQATDNFYLVYVYVKKSGSICVYLPS